MWNLWMRAGRYWMDVAAMQRDAMLTIGARQPIIWREMMAGPFGRPETAQMVLEKLAATQEIALAMAGDFLAPPTRSPLRAAVRNMRSAERYLKPLKQRTRANARRLGRSRKM